MNRVAASARKQTLNRVADTGSNSIWDEPERAMPGIPAVVYDWSYLIGYPVQVRLAGRTLRSGQVEDVTYDGCALWLAAEPGFDRQLIDQGSGYQVLLDSDQHYSFRQRLAAITSVLRSPEPAKESSRA
jgi:hypothetical protein